MRLIAILGGMAAALALTGCGFSPIYATAGADFAPLRDIRVETRGDERIDFIFEQVMSDKLGAYSPSNAYRLETILRETRQGFGIRVDDVATRYESTVTADFRLIRASDGVELTRGRRIGVASYDVSDDPYSELSSELRSLERAVELVAEKVRLDLTLYFADAGQEDS